VSRVNVDHFCRLRLLRAHSKANASRSTSAAAAGIVSMIRLAIEIFLAAASSRSDGEEMQ
jgi:hypothetical protein